MLEGETRRFDEAILLWMRDAVDLSNLIGPGWIEEIGRDFAALGGIVFLVMILLATSGLLTWQDKNKAALWLLLSTARLADGNAGPPDIARRRFLVTADRARPRHARTARS